jgi:ParB family chromosome partitioning protein
MHYIPHPSGINYIVLRTSILTIASHSDTFPGMAKPALGRGLGALLGGASANPERPRLAPLPPPHISPSPSSGAGEREIAARAQAIQSSRDLVRKVPLSQVRPCSFQPRKEFSAETLQELAESIKQQGILQPLIVRDVGTHLELIAGERRWRAAELAGLKEIPVIVREADNRLVLELALIENLQRDNLNPLEEALGYAQLIDQFQLRQEDVAVKVGKSRALVANALRLLKLDPELQAFLRDGRLSVGHAKVILALISPAEQKLAAERVIKENLNVRQTEELVSHLQNHKPASSAGKSANSIAARDPHVLNVETRLREHLGTKVQLRYRQGKGAIEIRYFSDDELERLLGLLGVQVE